MNILLSLLYHTHMTFRKINWFLYKNKVTFRGYAHLNWGTLILGMSNKDQVIIGKGADINGRLTVGKKGKIVLGDYVLTGPRSMIQSLDNVEVGRFTYIGPDVLIMDSNHHSIYAKYRMIDVLGVEKGISGTHAITQPIKIGNHVWIGRNAMIFKGVTVGDRSIIAAGAIVTHDVPEDVIVAGAPARVVKKIDQEKINPDEALNVDELLKLSGKEMLERVEKKLVAK